MEKNSHSELIKSPQSQILKELGVKVDVSQVLAFQNWTLSEAQLDGYFKDKLKDTKDWVNQFNWNNLLSKFLQ